MVKAKAAPEKEVDTALLVTAKNPRGIPEVVFIVSAVRYVPRREAAQQVSIPARMAIQYTPNRRQSTLQ